MRKSKNLGSVLIQSVLAAGLMLPAVGMANSPQDAHVVGKQYSAGFKKQREERHERHEERKEERREHREERKEERREHREERRENREHHREERREKRKEMMEKRKEMRENQKEVHQMPAPGEVKTMPAQ